ncbi:MAG: universal stress protein [Nitrososphaerota archaeon]|nr:universal stress protein [Nitrososphaerota archaeon]
MKKIFVGYDGTESSARALEFALKTLQEGGAPQSMEVHLAYVVEKPHGIADPVTEEVVESLRRAGAEILSNGARLVRKQLETPVTHLEFGSPPEKLLELADKIIPDIVVIGIAKHPASERILGTVSALFFKTRRYPVLGVP